MEGYLSMPPDRGPLIGRAAWKTRYVVLGPQSKKPGSSSRSTSGHSIRGTISAPIPLGELPPPYSLQPSWISIYKQKGDLELVQEYPVSSIQSCDVQGIRIRKDGPAITTLILATNASRERGAHEKCRMRRASTVLSSASSNNGDTLMFRTCEEDLNGIYSWHSAIHAVIPTSTIAPLPTSPVSFSTFSATESDFSKPSYTFSYESNSSHTFRQIFTCSSSGSTSHDRLYKTSSRQTHDGTISRLESPSPSLKSHSSTQSSVSSTFKQPITSHHQPRDSNPIFPIPPSRISHASNHKHLTGYSSSAAPIALPNSPPLTGPNASPGSTSPTTTTSSDPPRRQTILDRAFELHKIPGTDLCPKASSPNLSSIARFEALMHETESQLHIVEQQQAEGLKHEMRPQAHRSKTMHICTSSDLSSRAHTGAVSHASTEQQQICISTTTQRALDYIAARNATPPSRASSRTAHSSSPPALIIDTHLPLHRMTTTTSAPPTTTTTATAHPTRPHQGPSQSQPQPQPQQHYLLPQPPPQIIPRPLEPKTIRQSLQSLQNLRVVSEAVKANLKSRARGGSLYSGDEEAGVDSQRPAAAGAVAGAMAVPRPGIVATAVAEGEKQAAMSFSTEKGGRGGNDASAAAASAASATASAAAVGVGVGAVEVECVELVECAHRKPCHGMRALNFVRGI